MPKSQFDWLTGALLWVGALVMAIKTGDLPLIEGAPDFLAANWWGYVPFTLLTLFLILAIIDHFRPKVLEEAADEANEVAKPAAPAPEVSERAENQKREKVIRALESADRWAGYALAEVNDSRKMKRAGAELPGARAALLSANKAFGIPIIPRASSPVVELLMYRGMIEKILPYMEQGHLDEAREEAQKFIDDVAE